MSIAHPWFQKAARDEVWLAIGFDEEDPVMRVSTLTAQHIWDIDLGVGERFDFLTFARREGFSTDVTPYFGV